MYFYVSMQSMNSKYTIQQSPTITVPLHFGSDTPSFINTLQQQQHNIFLIDEQVFQHHSEQLKGADHTIIIKSGEAAKDIQYIMYLMEQLLELKVQRSDRLVGIGGGVVSDITGFLGSTYKRGMNFAFFPTTILGMVDAAIGGKNGINIGQHKNMMGCIRQPEFIAFDYTLLSSLPHDEWINGFAEIIKHACIHSTDLFETLQANDILYYKNTPAALARLIQDNVNIKTGIINNDAHEKGNRKLLNFGHSIGHYIEKAQAIPHGKAISIGMYTDSLISEKITGFKDTSRIKKILEQYLLPTTTLLNVQECLHYIANDKKAQSGGHIDYILLQSIGKACIKNITLQQLEGLIQQ